MPRKKIITNGEIKNFKNGKLENDNVFVGGHLLSMENLTGFKPKKGLEKVLVINGEIINVVSNQWGWLRNEEFFGAIEEKLTGAGISFDRRSINRDNKTFRVDYILNDESFHINIKGNKKDLIKPMISATSSYDNTISPSGHIGLFRRICSNGNHVTETELDFRIRRRANITELYIEKIEETIAHFMENEFYSLHKKFEVLAESPISDVEGFVKYTLGKTGLFKYAKSEKNPDVASAGAQFVIDVINAEATELKTKPNLWLGYNAFNEYIHTQNEKVFTLQEEADKKIFAAVMAQVN